MGYTGSTEALRGLKKFHFEISFITTTHLMALSEARKLAKLNGLSL